MSRKRDTKQEILNLAREYMVTRGFNGFSYQDLAKDLGIRKASIHYHYPTKEDLGLALINEFTDYVRAWAKDPAVAEASPTDRLKAYFAKSRSSSGDGSRICMMGVCSAEWGTLGPAMQERIALQLERKNKWLTQIIEDGRAAGEFAPGIAADQLSNMISTSVQGALQQARIYQDPKLFDQIVEQLTNLIQGAAAA